MKQFESQEIQKVLSAVQTELRSRQDTSFSPVHEVSSILHTLLKDGALRTNIPKLSAFSGERAKGDFRVCHMHIAGLAMQKGANGLK